MARRTTGPRRCPRCGRQGRSDAWFCDACGADTRAAVAVTLDVETDDEDGGPDHEVTFARPPVRRRFLVGGGVVVALGVAIGASIASGGGSDGGRAVATTTRIGSAGTADVTTTAGGATADPSSTASVPTDEQATPLGPVRLRDDPLFDRPTGLVLWAKLGAELYRVDADAGVASPVRSSVLGFVPAVGGHVTSVGIVLDDPGGRLLFAAGGADDLRPLVGAVAGATDATAGSGEQFIGEGPPGRLWLVRRNPAGPELGYVEPASGGAFTAVALPAVDFVGEPVADGLGGVVFSAPGGVYRWQPGTGAVSATRIAAGQLRDAGHGSVLTITCSDTLQCGWQVLDLRTGATWDADTGGEQVRIDAAARLSPDGRRFVVWAPTSAGPPTVAVLDSGGGHTAPDIAPGDLPVWSTDGAWLVAARGNDTIVAWHDAGSPPLTARLPLVAGTRAVPVNGLFGASPATPTAVAG